MLRVQIMAENIIPFVYDEDKFVSGGGKHIGNTVKFSAFKLRVGSGYITFERVFDQIDIVIVGVAFIGKVVQAHTDDVVFVQVGQVIFAFANL